MSYRVRGASWRPVYDARLDTRGAKPALAITRRALVRQTTGEDWTEASLTLSTLRVSRGTAVPELSGERIAFYEPRPPMPAPMPRAAAPQPEALAMAMAGAAADSARQKTASPMREAIEEARVESVSSAFETEFAVPGKVSLPSGNEEKSLRLGQETIEPKLTHKAAPLLDATAYLETAFTLKGEAPMLAGEVLLNRDGAFIGKGRLTETAPGADIRLGFGADDRVKVSRVPVAREAREPGFLGSTKTDETRFRVDVKNLHAFAVEITVLDRMPISEDQAITVERLPDMTKPDADTVDDRRGVFAWKATLKLQEARAFINAYRIRWPAGREIRPQPIPR